MTMNGRPSTADMTSQFILSKVAGYLFVIQNLAPAVVEVVLVKAIGRAEGQGIHSLRAQFKGTCRSFFYRACISNDVQFRRHEHGISCYGCLVVSSDNLGA